jgi:hypothetical protein
MDIQAEYNKALKLNNEYINYLCKLNDKLNDKSNNPSSVEKKLNLLNIRNKVIKQIIEKKENQLKLHF